MTQKSLNAVFVGCVETSLTSLEAILKNETFKVNWVVSKKESNFNSDFADLSDVCRRHEIRFTALQDKWGTAQTTDLLKLKPDVMFCIGWSQLLPAEVIKIPKLGTIGFHPADLPKNRGRHPLIWALALGLRQTASTFFFMEQTPDSGPIISKRIIEISAADDAKSLYQKVLFAMPQQIDEIGKKILIDPIPATFQNNSDANHWRKRTHEDGIIDWRMAASSIHNLVRALAKPYPGAEFRFQSKSYKVWKTVVVSEHLANIEPGKVLSVGPNGIMVNTGHEALLMTHVDGTPPISKGDYL